MEEVIQLQPAILHSFRLRPRNRKHNIAIAHGAVVGEPYLLQSAYQT